MIGVIGVILIITLLSPTIVCADQFDNEKMVFILGEIAKMKSTIMAEHDAKMTELKESYEAKMTGLKAELKADYEAKLTELKYENNDLRRRVNQLESETQGHESAMETPEENSQQMTVNNVLSSELKPTSSRRQKVRQSGQVYAGQVAFTAGVSTYELTGLGAHHTIVFDKTITNTGGAYHPHSGMFYAPIKGVYVFSVTLMVSPNHSQYLELVVDGNPLHDMYADASSTDDNVSTHRQWILEVQQGSEVWVRTRPPGQIHGNMHTAFSGFLLYELE